MKCPSCQALNDDGHRYCSNCGAALALSCHHCGATVIGAAKFCSNCGRVFARADNRSALTHDAKIPYERKHVSILFSDLCSSLNLIDDDPDVARRLLEDVIKVMSEAVRDNSGTVNQVMGDGIMAIFGAPFALEEHALRACFAALAMQEGIRKYAKNSKQPIAIRVGICSGDVIAGERGDDLESQYTAFGRTAHLASRMEVTAKPGTIQIAEATWRLVAECVDVHSKGPVEVRGLDHPIGVFELVGINFDVLENRQSDRSLPFVGREFETNILNHALEEANAGHGRVVAMVGEPGVGKSRLLDEFVLFRADQNMCLLRASSFSHLKPPPFHAIRQILFGFFAVEPKYSFERQREIIERKFHDLQADTGKFLSALLALINPGDVNILSDMPVNERRERVGQAFTTLILAQSRLTPVLLAVDDLQWIDSDSLAILTQFARYVSKARVFLLVAYRPDYLQYFDAGLNYFQLPLQSLSTGSVDILLDHLLGTDARLTLLRRLLLERIDGNPFFLEESVRSLVNDGSLQGKVGNYSLRKSIRKLEMPARVQDVTAMRIDQLTPVDKIVLQAAAVIGYEVEWSILAAVTDVSDQQLARILERLEVADLLLVSPQGGSQQLGFRHAIIHDVVYSCLLQEDRQRLHGRTLTALENRYPDCLEDHAQTIAFHASGAEDWDKAITFLRMAGNNALLHSACQRAAECFEEGLALVRKFPPENCRVVELDFRLYLRNALMPLGRHRELLPHLEAARELAETEGDDKRFAQSNSFLSHCYWLVGDWDKSLETGEMALLKADEQEDIGLAIVTRFFLGLSAYSKGRFYEAIEYLGLNAKLLTGDRVSDHYNMFALPSVVCRGWLAWCLIELGRFEDAIPHAREAYHIANEVGRPFDRVQGLLGLGGTLLLRGQVDEASDLLETAQHLCDEADVRILKPRVIAALGFAYGQQGRLSEAVSLVNSAMEAAETMSLASMHTICQRWAAEVLLLSREGRKAAELSDQLLMTCRETGERGSEAWALYLKGAALAELGESEAALSNLKQAEAIAKKLGMNLLLAHIVCRRGHLCEAENGKEDRIIAGTLFRDMGMDGFVRAQ